jgi:hypothetical protein
VIRGVARVVPLWAALIAAHVWACSRTAPRSLDPQPIVTAKLSQHPIEVAEAIFDAGLANKWQDWGWAPREIGGNGPAKVRFSDHGGWILAKPGLAGTYGGIIFRVKAPPGEPAFLELRVESGTTATFPRVRISQDYGADAGEGWTQVFVPMSALNPDANPFDRIVFWAFRPFPTDWVFLDGIALTSAGAPSLASPSVPLGKPAVIRLACDAKATRISPLIYGFGGGTDGQAGEWKFGGTIHRWGGNPTSTYNWELDVWNLGSDWFFENHSTESFKKVLADDAAHDATTALTVPMLGWVARDATSYSFPVSVFGAQAKTDPWHPDAGNGTAASGRELRAGPSRAGVAAPADSIRHWLSSIRAGDKEAGARTLREYILDNEPMLWHRTHRDVRPDPLGYDELLERTIQYGSAIRQADPDAVIAGPAEWGWPAYFFSAKDSVAGIDAKPDRRAHGDVALVEWYLRTLREKEETTGVRVLDVLDLHYYPQADNVYGGGKGGTDRQTAALRLRSTRSLWDPSYIDESWIRDTVRLLPRMKEWVDKNYPGRGISIGEWNFGGEGHITGALATAEALGRFAQFGVSSAFYWTFPPPGSPSAQGFLAYRNFDGKGGRFLDWYVPATTSEDASVFASRNDEGKHVVAIAINMSPDRALRARFDLGTCGGIASHQSYVYAAGMSGFAGGVPVQGGPTAFEEVLPPWSITAIDIWLARGPEAGLER